MAQAKVTSYYTRRKRIDDAQPSKRRKLVSSSGRSGVVADTGESSVLDEADLKAGLQAFTKQLLLPKVDRTVLLEDTISQCATTRTRSTRKSRATQARSSKKTTKGPLDVHLQKVTAKTNVRPSSKLSVLPLPFDLQTDSFNLLVSELPTQQRSPPSTPTKRSQHSDEAPSRKKRSRIGSDDVTLETDESCSLSGASSSLQPVRISRKKVQAEKQPSKVTTRGRSAKKSLEASLLEFAKSDVHIKDKVPEEGNVSSSLSTTTPSKTSQLTKPPSLKSSSTTQGTSDTSSSPRSNSGLRAFIDQTSRSVASSSIKASKVNSALSDRIKEAVSEVKSESTVKTKLTPAQMKERLSKSCKLSDLQARLAKVKECADQAKKPVKDVPIANTKATASPPTTIVKTEEQTLPAYQKYHALVSTAPPTLGLPFKYKLLEEMFRSTDTIVSMLHNRSEICSFAKVKKAVQEMCRRTFEQHNLGQIKTVYPTAYFLRQEKLARSKTKGYELVLEANTGSGIGTSTGQERSECMKRPSQTDAKGDIISKLMRKLTPSMLIARRSIFHNNLVDIVKEHHNEFLSKLDRPLSVPGDKLTRWHPKFALDQVPDISPSALPQPPTVATYNTAKDVLDKARVMMNPRVAKALEVVAKNSALLKAEKDLKAAAEQKTSIKTEAPKKPETKSVSGVSQSLLDRIRAKEAKNLTAMMTRSPADQERIAMLERLPELCRILRVFFVSEKKAALPIEAIVEKLCESYPSILSKAQVEKHVGLMVEVLPDWLSKVTVRKDHYLKMNKTKDMGQVNHKVNQLLRESKQPKGQS